MIFSKVPFLFLLPSLLIGILILGKVDDNFLISILILLFSLLSYLLLSLKDSFLTERIKVFLIFTSVFATGGLLISGERSKVIPVVGESSFIVSVNEISSSGNDWRKSICTIESIFQKDTVIKHSEKVVLFFNVPEIKAGDILLIQTDLERIKNKNNPGEFDLKSFWNNKNIYQIGFVSENDLQYLETVELSKLKEFFEGVRGSLKRQLNSVLDGEVLGIANALLLGDKELLSTETRISFSNAGAMHVLAVSGLHVGIVLVILMFLLGRLTRFVSKQNATIIAIIIIWIYAGVTGFSPSVMRASFMFSILAIAQMSGRNNNSMNTLLFSAFVLLVFNPLWIYDIGFQLSYLAMLGIFLLFEPISRLVYIKNHWLMKVWQGTAIGISAQVFTVPLTLYYFHQFPNYFVLTNIGMMVFAGLVLGIGLFFFVFNWSSIFSWILGNLLKIGLLSMLFFVQMIDSLPFSVATGFSLSEELIYLIYFLMIVLVIKSFQKYKTVVLLSFVLIFTQIQYRRYQNITGREMVVFNSDDFAMSIKYNNQIVCLHSAKKERVKRIEMLMKQYVSIKPGEYKLLYLKDGKTTLNFGGDDFVFYTDKYGVTVESEKVKLHVRTNYSGNFLELNNSYDMSYLAKNSDRYNLGEGAKIIPLN